MLIQGSDLKDKHAFAQFHFLICDYARSAYGWKLDEEIHSVSRNRTMDSVYVQIKMTV